MLPPPQLPPPVRGVVWWGSRREMSSFLMNSSGYAGADPKFPPSEEYSSQSYLQHSDYYNQQMAAAQHYGYGVGSHNYPGARDPMGYSGYYQQCSAMSPHQQVK